MVIENTFGESGVAAVCIDFDVKAGVVAEEKYSNEEALHEGLIINSAYTEMEGDVESRLSQLSEIKGNSANSKGAGGVLHLDGRWLLCGQHLAAWSMLWAPKLRPYLPSLGLLISRLVHAEQYLEKY
jgi:hypothetical protein